MARRKLSPLALLLACLALQQAVASSVHPDLLRFLRPAAAPSLEQEGQQTGRKLQQTFSEPEQPFSFDGFGFGFGGWFPGGGGFDGFATNIYQILFRDLLNAGLNEYMARSLPNELPNPLNFVPPEFGRPFRRDVVSLVGYDYFEKWIGQYYTFASAELGELVDGGCVAPVYSLNVNGGSCEILEDNSVECEQPKIVLKATPLTCNLPYRSAPSLEGAGWQYKAQFGKERKGEIGPPAGVYNLGAAVNITSPYLGFSAQLQRVANDFGVQQWWQFLGNLVLNEILRIQAALLSGAVDVRINTAERDDRAAGVFEGRPFTFNMASEVGVQSGVEALRSAGSNLMDRIAGYMGLSTPDLTSGLKAAGILKPQAVRTANSTQKQQQAPQPKKQAGAQTPSATAGAGAAKKPAAQATAAPKQPGSLAFSQASNEGEGSSQGLAQLDKELAATAAKKPAAAGKKAPQAKPQAKAKGAAAAPKPKASKP